MSVALPAVAEIAKAVQVGMDEDALDLAVGHGQQNSRERTVVSPEDHRRLPVELSLLDVERCATRRRRHESGDVPCALERPPEVAEAPDRAALGPPSVMSTGVGREQVHEACHVACGGRAQEGFQQLLVLLA